MLFLLPHEDGKETVSNLDDPPLEEMNESVENEDDPDLDIISSNFENTAEKALPSPRRKKVKKSFEDNLIEILKQKKNEENELDEDKLFMLSCVPTL